MFPAGFLTSPLGRSLAFPSPRGRQWHGGDALPFDCGVTVAGTVPDSHRIPFSCSATDADRCITKTRAKLGAVFIIPIPHPHIDSRLRSAPVRRLVFDLEILVGQIVFFIRLHEIQCESNLFDTKCPAIRSNTKWIHVRLHAIRSKSNLFHTKCCAIRCKTKLIRVRLHAIWSKSILIQFRCRAIRCNTKWIHFRLHDIRCKSEWL